LHLKQENIADTVLLVGDPGRVEKLSSLFDSVENKVENREFVTHTGMYNGKRLSALSTGIGTDNIDIVLNELDALVNIDLEKRIAKKEKKSLDLIRVGTTGGVQTDVPVGSFALSRIAGGFDGLLHYYRDGYSICDEDIEKAFVSFTTWYDKRPVPYFVWASERLFNKLNHNVQSGITISSPGFYGPQGRTLRLPVTDPLLNDKIHNFAYNDLRIINYEMESSALFGLSALLGHNAVSICAVIANRITGEFISDYEPVITDLLKYTLDQITGPGE
jgi:uridine phosphorylase